MMKRQTYALVPAILAGALLSGGCESMSGTAKGGLIGGGAGAGLGALAGSASGNAGKGALIGGLAGTVIGGIVGNDVDSEEKKRTERRLAVAESRPAMIQSNSARLGVFDVIQLSKEGMNEDVIINQIRSTGSTFQLSTEDVRALSANNVSPRVIVEMQNRQPVARVVHQQPQVIYHHRPQPVYVVDPYGPPPPVIGAGFYTRVR